MGIKKKFYKILVLFIVFTMLSNYMLICSEVADIAIATEFKDGIKSSLELNTNENDENTINNEESLEKQDNMSTDQKEESSFNFEDKINPNLVVQNSEQTDENLTENPSVVSEENNVNNTLEEITHDSNIEEIRIEDSTEVNNESSMELENIEENISSDFVMPENRDENYTVNVDYNINRVTKFDNSLGKGLILDTTFKIQINAQKEHNIKIELNLPKINEISPLKYKIENIDDDLSIMHNPEENKMTVCLNKINASKEFRIVFLYNEQAYMGEEAIITGTIIKPDFIENNQEENKDINTENEIKLDNDENNSELQADNEEEKAEETKIDLSNDNNPEINLDEKVENNENNNEINQENSLNKDNNEINSEDNIDSNKLEENQEINYPKEEIKIVKKIEEEVKSIGKYSLNTDIASKFKGLVYANLFVNNKKDVSFCLTDTIEIEDADFIDYIEVSSRDVFMNKSNEELEVQNGILYKKIEILKEEFDSVLGEKGYIEILDNEGTKIGEIRNTSEISNDKYVYKYPSLISKSTLRFINAENNGKLDIRIEKAIAKDINLEKDEIFNLASIKLENTHRTIKKIDDLNVALQEISAQSEIRLEDTKTEITLEMDTNNLSTQTDNKVIYNINLKSNSEEYEIFKNPEIEMTFPYSVQDVEIDNISLLHRNGLSLSNWGVEKNEYGEIVLRVKLDGTQEEFNPGTLIDGVTINIATNIKVDRLTTSEAGNIKLRYSNEAGTSLSYEKEGKNVEEYEIKYVSNSELLTVSSFEDFNSKFDVLSEINADKLVGKADIGGEKRVSTVKLNVINNLKSDINNVTVLGKLPVIGNIDNNGNSLNTTVDVNLSGEILVSGLLTKVYYSEELNADLNGDSWVENVSDFSKVKCFKIEIENETVHQGENIDISYDLVIPENLDYNQNIYGINTISYKLNNESKIKDIIYGLETETKEISIEDFEEIKETEKIIVGTKVTRGGEELTEDESVNERQILRYTTIIKNTSNEPINNIKLQGNAHNANMFYWHTYNVISSSTGEETTTGEWIEDVENKHLYDSIEILSLEPGESKLFEYQVIVNDLTFLQDINDKTVYGQIVIEADGIEKREIKTNKNPIINGEIEIHLYRNGLEDISNMIIETGNEYYLKAYVKNITSNVLNNVEINFYLPQNIKYNGLTEILHEEYNISVKETSSGSIVTIVLEEINPNNGQFIYLHTKIANLDYSIASSEETVIVKAIVNNREYKSNDYTRTITQNRTSFDFDFYGNKEDGSWVKNGEEIEYTFIAENLGSINKNIEFEYFLPYGLDLQNISLLKENDTENLYPTNNDEGVMVEGYSEENRIFKKYIDINSKEKITIKIKAMVNVEKTLGKQENIISKIDFQGNTLDKFITYYIEYPQGMYEENEEEGKDFVDERPEVEIPNDDNSEADLSSEDNVEENSDDNKEKDEISTKDSEKIESENSVIVNNTQNDELDIVEIKNGEIEKNNTENDEPNRNETINDESDANEKEDAKVNNDVIIAKETTSKDEGETTKKENIIETENKENNSQKTSIEFTGTTKSLMNAPQASITPSVENIAVAKKVENEELYTISGTVLVEDNNKSTEMKIANTSVKLYYADDNRVVKSTSTDKIGRYEFNNIEKGNYIVLFSYDNDLYNIASDYYEDNSSNINHISVKEINGIKYGISDIINLKNSNAININMVLKEKNKFDIEIKTYLSKINVKTENGVENYTYNDNDLSKIEIPAKHINNAEITATFNIAVINKGNVTGYVSSINDITSGNWTFNESLNKNWKVDENGSLYCSALENTPIVPNDSKVIKLILTKKMTEENTGVFINISSIQASTNELQLNDINLDNNVDECQVLISIKTGAKIYIIILAIAILVSLLLFSICNFKIFKNSKNKRKLTIMIILIWMLSIGSIFSLKIYSYELASNESNNYGFEMSYNGKKIESLMGWATGGRYITLRENADMTTSYYRVLDYLNSLYQKSNGENGVSRWTFLQRKVIFSSEQWDARGEYYEKMIRTGMCIHPSTIDPENAEEAKNILKTSTNKSIQLCISILDCGYSNGSANDVTNSNVKYFNRMKGDRLNILEADEKDSYSDSIWTTQTIAYTGWALENSTGRGNGWNYSKEVKDQNDTTWRYINGYLYRDVDYYDWTIVPKNGSLRIQFSEANLPTHEGNSGYIDSKDYTYQKYNSNTKEWVTQSSKTRLKFKRKEASYDYFRSSIWWLMAHTGGDNGDVALDVSNTTGITISNVGSGPEFSNYPKLTDNTNGFISQIKSFNNSSKQVFGIDGYPNADNIKIKDSNNNSYLNTETISGTDYITGIKLKFPGAGRNSNINNRVYLYYSTNNGTSFSKYTGKIYLLNNNTLTGYDQDSDYGLNTSNTIFVNKKLYIPISIFGSNIDYTKCKIKIVNQYYTYASRFMYMYKVEDGQNEGVLRGIRNEQNSSYIYTIDKAIKIEKSVDSIDGSTSNTTYAENGSTVQYKIVLSNIGASALSNIKFTDTHTDLEYVSCSRALSTTNGTDFTYSNNIAKGGTATVYINYKVTKENENNSEATVTNSVKVTNISNGSLESSVTIKLRRYSYTINKYIYSIDGVVLNPSRSELSETQKSANDNKVYADYGSTVIYCVKIKNIGNDSTKFGNIKNVVLKDSIPSGLSFYAAKQNGSNYVNGTSSGDLSGKESGDWKIENNSGTIKFTYTKTVTPGNSGTTLIIKCTSNEIASTSGSVTNTINTISLQNKHGVNIKNKCTSNNTSPNKKSVFNSSDTFYSKIYKYSINKYITKIDATNFSRETNKNTDVYADLGSTITYNIKIKNEGTANNPAYGDIKNIKFNDTFTTGELTFSNSISGTNWTKSNNTYTYSGTITPGSASNVLTITCTNQKIAKTTQSVTNTATITQIKNKNNKDIFGHEASGSTKSSSDTFKTKIYNVEITKLVANGTDEQGNTIWDRSRNAEIGDTVLFRIQVKNNGSTPVAGSIKNVVIKDILTDNEKSNSNYYLQFRDFRGYTTVASEKVFVTSGTSKDWTISNVSANELNLTYGNTIAPGSSAYVYVRYNVIHANTNNVTITNSVSKTTVKNAIGNGKDVTSYTNTTYINGTNSSQATVRLKKYSANVKKFITAVQSVNSTTNYSGRDTNKTPEVTAEYGDIVIFKIVVSNNGNNANDYGNIRDFEITDTFTDTVFVLLPDSKQSYGTNWSRNGNTFRFSGNLAPNTSTTLTIKLKVDSDDIPNSVPRDANGDVIAGNTASMKDTAVLNKNNVNINTSPDKILNGTLEDSDTLTVLIARLRISKYLIKLNDSLITNRRTYSNTNKFNNPVEVEKNDTVRYRIRIENVGRNKLTYMRYKDTLEDGIIFNGANIVSAKMFNDSTDTTGRTVTNSVSFITTSNELVRNIDYNSDINPNEILQIDFNCKIQKTNLYLLNLTNKVEIVSIKNKNNLEIYNTPFLEIKRFDTEDYVRLKNLPVYGTVWLDENLNGLMDTNEPKIQGAKITLFDDTNGKKTTVFTDNTGKYTFTETNGEASRSGATNLNKKMVLSDGRVIKATNRNDTTGNYDNTSQHINYYIAFEYDGSKFETVPLSVYANDKNITGSDNSYNNKYEKDTNAIEDVLLRKAFNNGLETISYNNATSSTGENKVLEYDKDGHVSTISIIHDTAASMFAYSFMKEDKTATDGIQNGDVRYLWFKDRNGNYDGETEYLKYINMGLTERKFDLKIEQDVYSVKTTINGQSLTYNYSKRGTAAEFGGEYDTNPYELKLYNSDYNYNSNMYSNDEVKNYKANTELNAEVTFKIKVTNENVNDGKEVYSEIKEIADYYSNNFMRLGTTKSIKTLNSNGTLNTRTLTSVEAWYRDNGVRKNLTISADPEYGETRDLGSENYSTLYITGFKDNSGKNIKLNEGESLEFYIKFIVDKQNDKLILGPEKNVAEINAYSTYKKTEEPAGYIDRDSNPGNTTVIGRTEDYEDDTFRTGITFSLGDDSRERKTSGIVWDDSKTEQVDTTSVVTNGAHSPNYSSPDDTPSEGEENDNAEFNASNNDLSNVVGAQESKTYSQYYGDGLYNRGVIKDNDAIENDKVTKLLNETRGKSNNKGNERRDIPVQDVKVSMVEIIKIPNGSSYKYYEETIDPSGNGTIVSTTNGDGRYTISSFIPGKYETHFEYGYAEGNNVSQNMQVFNGHDYKSTQYYSTIDTKTTYDEIVKILTDSSSKHSDARDDEIRRLEVIDYSEQMTNKKVENIQRASTSNVSQKEFAENTQMFARTIEYKIEPEYFSHVSDDGVSKSSSYTINNTGYGLDNIDFGIEYRPVTGLLLQKYISNIRVILSTGEDLLNIKYNNVYENGDNTKITGTIIDKANSVGTENLQELRTQGNVKGFEYINIDTDVLQGATIKIEYLIVASNESEVDRISKNLDDLRYKEDVPALYNAYINNNNYTASGTAKNKLISEYYENYGTNNKYRKELLKAYSGSEGYYGQYLGNMYYTGSIGPKDVVAKLQIDKILDYVDTDIAFYENENNSQNNYWKTINSTTLFNEGLVSRGSHNPLVDSNGIRYSVNDGLENEMSNLAVSVNDRTSVNDTNVINDSLSKYLLPSCTSNTENFGYIKLMTSKVLASETDTDNMRYDNTSEIIEYTAQTGRATQAKAYSALGQTVGNVDTSVPNIPEERDSSFTETVTLTPPTGLDKLHYYVSIYMNYGLIIISGILIITCGLFAGIKLKNYKKFYK